MTVDPHETCWTIVHAATRGDPSARSTFGRFYLTVVRDFFSARWRGGVLRGEIDDAAQEVFVECLKSGGVLDRADPGRGDFRGLLFGVSRNVARRFEERATARDRLQPEDSAWLRQLASSEASLETQFDRDWAKALIRQARGRQREQALADGEEGGRRLELLQRRFHDDEAIRDIASRWNVPAARVHQIYRNARDEFYRCLRDVVGHHAQPGAELDAECRRLLALLRQ